MLAFGRNTKVGRAVQKVIVKKARILVCLDWRLLGTIKCGKTPGRETGVFAITLCERSRELWEY